MRKSTIIIVVAVIVALVIVRGIQEFNKSRRKPPPGGGFVKIVPEEMRAADINKIEIYRGSARNEAIVLARGQDGWGVPSRFNSKANEKNIGDLLDGVKKLSGELRTKKKELHADFGITSEKAVHISLYKKEEKPYRTVLLGKRGERWGEGFVRLADSDEVYLADMADRNLLTTLGIYDDDDKPDAKKWLDLKIIDRQSEKVAKVALDMPGKQVVLEKKEKKKEEKPEEKAGEEEKPPAPEEKKEEKKEYEWVLVKPEVEFTMKDWAAKSLVSSISQFTGEDVADPAKMDEYGFDSPSYTAAITMEDGAGETLLLGKKTESDNKRYARLKDGKTVYIVPQYTVTGVFKKMKDLLDIKIWDLKKEDVASVDLRMPAYEILLERRPKEGTEGKQPKDLQWVLVKPETRFKLKDFRIDNVLTRAIKPVPDDLFLAGELQSYGLDQPEFKAVLKMRDDSTQTILVGKKVEGGEERYSKFEGKNHVYSMAKFDFENLFPTLGKLLTIEIMEGLEKDQIVSLRYDTAEEDFVLACKGDGEEAEKKKWSVKIGDEEAEARSNIVDDLLDAITGIEPEDMVVGKSDADCGLDEPAETIAISTKETPERYVLLFGKRVSEETTPSPRYFKIKDQPEILVLSEASLGRILKKVKDLKVEKPPEPKVEEKPPGEEKAVPLPEEPPTPRVEETPGAPAEKPPVPEEKPKGPPQKEGVKIQPEAMPQKPEGEKEKVEPPLPEKEGPPPQPEGEKKPAESTGRTVNDGSETRLCAR